MDKEALQKLREQFPEIVFFDETTLYDAIRRNGIPWRMKSAPQSIRLFGGENRKQFRMRLSIRGWGARTEQ